MNQDRSIQILKMVILGVFIAVVFRRLLPLMIPLLLFYVFKQKAEGREIVPDFLSNIFHSGKPKIKFVKSSSTLNQFNNMKNLTTKFISTIIGFFVLFLVGINSFVIIDAGSTGVQSLFGKVYERELSSGFHLKNPFVRITQMNIRTQDYTMSTAQGEGTNVDDDSIAALTKEGLRVDLDITILYHLREDVVSDIYRNLGIGYEETVLRPQIRSTIREVISNYDAKEVYSEKRDDVSVGIFDKLQSSLNSRGIEIESVLLRNVRLPDNLAESIQQKLQAEQESERYDFILSKEKKEAERKRIEAEGQRDAQKIINESLTPRYLEYLYISSLEKREGTIYVPTDPSNGLPMFRGL